MKVLSVRNVHQALPRALQVLQQHGYDRPSRNGTVRLTPFPVTTEYARPTERVVFWPQRDANPAFHLFESLWMLAGRNDLAPLLRYVKDFGRFSDDGQTLHGAYGYRWRVGLDADQLPVIADALTEDPNDRRAVLQMWDCGMDLAWGGKDVPCNLMATFQVTRDGALDLTVFCRSNDIILGAYGANAVHFSMLQEYMALWIGCPVGVYRQVSVNWHAYDGDQLRELNELPRLAFNAFYAEPRAMDDPYVDGTARVVPIGERRHGETGRETIARVDAKIAEVLLQANTGFALPKTSNDEEPFFDVVYAVLRAHEYWRTRAAPERYEQALAVLAAADQTADWVQAMTQWIDRRYTKWDAKMRREEVPS